MLLPITAQNCVKPHFPHGAIVLGVIIEQKKGVRPGEPADVAVLLLQFVVGNQEQRFLRCLCISRRRERGGGRGGGLLGARAQCVMLGERL